MGIRLELAPHLIRLMSAEDQARYGTCPGVIPVSSSQWSSSPQSSPSPSSKTDASERKEQASFANWLLLQNSNGRKIPFSWHATHTRSKATPGTPDFWVGINRHGVWIEFKRDYSCKLSPEQEEFRVRCAYQNIEWHVVYSAHEAIQIVERADAPI